MPPKTPAARTTASKPAPKTILPIPSPEDQIKAAIATNSCSNTILSLLNDFLFPPLPSKSKSIAPVRKTTIKTPTTTPHIPSKRDQQRLASAVINAALKALSDAAKVLEAPESESGGGPADPSALKPRSGNVVDKSTVLDKFDYLASCCSASMTFLSLPENQVSTPQELIMEKARYNLGMRLIKVGKTKAALKEFRTLKKMLEVVMGAPEVKPVKEPVKTTAKVGVRKTTGKENTTQADPSQKESISSILEYGPIDTSRPALSMAVDCQIGILRCIVDLKRPDIVEAIAPSLNSKHGPLALIKLLPESSSTKALTQLPILANSVAQLIPSASMSNDKSALDSSTYCSPMTALSLHTHYLECMLHLEALRSPLAGETKPFWTPFTTQLSAFIRRSKAYDKVERHRFVVETVKEVSSWLKHKRADDQIPTAVFKLLSFTAFESNSMSETQNWTNHWKNSMATNPDEADDASIALSNVRLAVIALKLVHPASKGPAHILSSETDISALEAQVNLATINLEEVRRGSKADLESLLQECGSFRRSAFNLLSQLLQEHPPDTPAQSALRTRAKNLCDSAIRSVIRYCRKYLAMGPDDLKHATPVIVSAVDAAVSTCWRTYDVNSPEAWDTLESTINYCQDVIKYLDKPDTPNPCNTFFVKASEAFWRLWQLYRKTPNSLREQARCLKNSIVVMDGRPVSELSAAHVMHKCERLAMIYIQYHEWDRALKQLNEALEIAVKTGLVASLAARACSGGEAPQRVFTTDEKDVSILKHVIAGFVDVGGKRRGDLHESGIFKFEKFGLTDEERGFLWEWCFSWALENPDLYGMVIQVLGEKLVELYDIEEMPVRRARLMAGLMTVVAELREMLDRDAVRALAEEVVEWAEQERGGELFNDEVLQGWVKDNVAGCYMGLAFEEWALEAEREAEEKERVKIAREQGKEVTGQPKQKTLKGPGYLKKALRCWRQILEGVDDWEALLLRVENPEMLSKRLKMLEEFFDMMGMVDLKTLVLELHIRLRKLETPTNGDALAKTLTSYALEQHRLGMSHKARIAFEAAQKIISDPVHPTPATTETRLQWHLAYAEFLLAIGQSDKGAEIYTHATDIARRQKELTGASMPKSPRALTNMQRTIASAEYATSILAYDRGNAIDSLIHARRSLRLYHRIWAMLARRNERKLLTSSIAMTDGDTSTGSKKSVSAGTGALDGESLKHSTLWPILPEMYRSFLQVIAAYRHLGMPREAICYCDEAIKATESVGAQPMTVEVLIMKGDLLVRMGNLEQGRENLELAREAELTGLPAAKLEIALANMFKTEGNTEEEMAAYKRALGIMAEIVGSSRTGREADGELVDAMEGLEIDASRPKTPSGRKTPTGGRKTPTRKTPVKRSTSKSRTLKSTKAAEKVSASVDELAQSGCTAIHKQQGQVYRLMGYSLATSDSWQEATEVIEKAEQLPLDRHEEIFQGVVHARTLLQEALATLSESPVFNVLLESTISLPNITMGGDVPVTVPKKGVRKTTANTTKTVANFREALEKARECIYAVHSRAVKWGSSTALTQTTTLMTAVIVLLSAIADTNGRGVEHPLYASYSLELRNGIVTRREKTAVQAEALSAQMEPIIWPGLESHTGTAHDILHTNTELAPFEFSTFLDNYINTIPKEWVVLNVSLSESKKEMIISRYQAGQGQFLVRLPLTRELEEDEETMSFEEGKERLETIIKAVNETSRSAKTKSKDGDRKLWWDEREDLDNQLKNLLQEMEDKWLGGFKGIFGQYTRNPELFGRFKASFDKILAKGLPSRRGKKAGSAAMSAEKTRVSIDRHVLELFIALGNPADHEDEEGNSDSFDRPLRDLFNFVIDILQFHGEAIAYDEVDFDQMIVSMLDVLRSYHTEAARLTPSGLPGPKTDHTILILDKHLQSFPWESLPSLTALSISRIQSLATLHEHLTRNVPPSASRPGHYIPRTSGGYVLNPDNDLNATVKTLSPPLNTLPGNWARISSRAPTEPEFASILTNTACMLYFGHGSGAHYIHPKIIRRMNNCAVTLLFGCSSGQMKDMGEFEPYGPPVNYCIAGAPAVVAMLWDVTDRDVDRFAVEVGGRWGLWDVVEEGKRGEWWREEECVEEGVKRPRGESLVEAVARGRRVCKLRYINGAAPVVYGIPVYVERD